MSTPDLRSGHEAMAAHFGNRLKYWRRSRGLTQAELARDLDVDGSYISKLESSRRHANPEFAKRCDDLLDTGGELMGLLNLIEGERAHSKQLAMPMPVAWPSPSAHAPPQRGDGSDHAVRVRANPHTTTTLYRLLESYTEIDRSMGGQQISDAVERQSQDLIGMHIGEPDDLSLNLLSLAARFARLAGWIRFDSCDRGGSLFWHDCARRWAIAGQQLTLAAEIQARQSIVYSTMGDPAGGLAMASAIPTTGDDSDIEAWGHAATAQAHAAAGDVDATLTALDSFDKIVAGLDEPLVSPPILTDNTFLRHTLVGKAHLHLVLAGADPERHGSEAARRFRAALTDLSSHHLRDIALTRLRLARSLVAQGDIDAARTEVVDTELVARRCTSPRVHAILRRQRSLTQLPDPTPVF
ncbi:helix-turn-helix domain-containing protein [Stackebrandtia soli]|uniref:helix-turn-helix transcriptional regulator n=1 Tax=Stackebrandtia soli TaxID=1892856 RepID=UPI0039EB709D